MGARLAERCYSGFVILILHVCAAGVRRLPVGAADHVAAADEGLCAVLLGVNGAG